MVESVINGKERFATEGIRFQRHNPDGTIPTAKRFVGFSNTADLTKVLDGSGNAEMKIKIDAEPEQIRSVNFSDAVNTGKISVEEAITALNNAGFSDIKFYKDEKTKRLLGRYGEGTRAVLNVRLQVQSVSNAPSVFPAGKYTLFHEGIAYEAYLPAITGLNVTQNSYPMAFFAVTPGAIPSELIPEEDDSLDVAAVIPQVPNNSTGFYNWASFFVDSFINGEPVLEGKIVQVTGTLAAVLDFGQGIKHGGNGLEVISFFDDETISIGLPKDIKDKEEIDIEGAKGTITRMVIGAMLQGLSPVVTLKQKNYYLLELIQGGRLERASGKYNPPLSHDSEHPSFWAEIFSGIYSAGSNKLSDVAGYERLLLRTMNGMEGDVPIDAKAWAQYAYNLTATEYTDENDVKFPAWEEQTLSLTDFDALNVKGVKI